MAEINNLFIYGKLPFVILMEDGFSADGSLDLIEENGIEILIEGIWMKVFLRKNVRKDQDYISLAMEDFNGKCSYSDFILTPCTESHKDFIALISEKENNINFDFAFEFVFKFLAKFITSYRSATKKHWMELQNMSQISPLKFLWLDENNDQKFSIKANHGTGIAIGSVISKIEVDHIRRFCNNEVDLTFIHQILMYVNQYKYRKDFKNHFIYLKLYFDSWVFRELRIQLLKSKNPDKKINEFFLKNNGDFIDIGQALKQFFGKNQLKIIIEKNNKTYQAFEQIKKFRDDLIHKESIPVVTDNEVGYLLTASLKFRDVLSKEIQKINKIL